nr:MAG TPA: hypothetical protein [Bacteriophage sp.]
MLLIHNCIFLILNTASKTISKINTMPQTRK